MVSSQGSRLEGVHDVPFEVEFGQPSSKVLEILDRVRVEVIGLAVHSHCQVVPILVTHEQSNVTNLKTRDWQNRVKEVPALTHQSRRTVLVSSYPPLHYKCHGSYN